MSGFYKLTYHESAAKTLAVVGGYPTQMEIMRAFDDTLGLRPQQFIRRTRVDNATGRKLHISTICNFEVTWWMDHLPPEIHVVEITGMK